MHASRHVLHVDMDAFFAAIEQRDDPALRGRPVLVGGAGPRGVVSTASYEARAFGCHSAQPMAVARRLCPQAVVVPTSGARYRAVSEQLFDLLQELTPQVEPLSVDEAFLDVTGCQRLHGDPVRIARTIKERVARELGLTASVGVSTNKFLAKLASDLEKPDGLTVIGPEDVRRVLDPLPIERLWGVGPATAARLRALGVRTFANLRAWSVQDLEARLGQGAVRFHDLVRGIDEREVTRDDRARSVGQEGTFPVDVEVVEHVRDVLRGQVEQVARRLRRGGLLCRTVGIKVRYGDFETITRSTTFREASQETDVLLHAALGLFDRWARRAFQPVRLIGVTASGLQERGEEQLDLFAGGERRRGRRLDAALDSIQDRFGSGAIQRGLGPRDAPERPPGPRDPSRP